MKYVLLVLALICTLAFVYNQGDQIYRRYLQDDAVRFCMRWRIPDAVVLDGNYYCKTDIQMYSPLGVTLNVPQIWSQKEMQTVFKKMEVSPYCSNTVTEDCIEP